MIPSANDYVSPQVQIQIQIQIQTSIFMKTYINLNLYCFVFRNFFLKFEITHEQIIMDKTYPLT
jgi:hypothetical protein